jgi:hypothetical protein
VTGNANGASGAQNKSLWIKVHRQDKMRHHPKAGTAQPGGRHDVLPSL